MGKDKVWNLNEEFSSFRCTRVVLGRPSSADISDIFEEETKDFLTEELITIKNFDNDAVFLIQGCGYTFRKSLISAGITKFEYDSIYDPIYGNQFK